MTVQLNAVRKSQIDQPNGVAGLDANGHLTNIGEIGHPPQINSEGAIEAIVAHRGDTLANLQALGPLPEGEIVIVKNGSGVPIGFRVGDAAETAGGYPIDGTLVRTQVENVTLDSLSFVLIPGMTLSLPANSLLEISGTLRWNTAAGTTYSVTWSVPEAVTMFVRDGAGAPTLNGGAMTLTGTGGSVILPPTIVKTTIAWNLEIFYQKISGTPNKVLTRGDLMYRVIG